jgi:hypothetical protein
METGIRRMQRSAQNGNKAFEELGISLLGTDGKLKETEALFLETGAALAKVENNTKKAALAATIFGRSGTMLLPVLKDGVDGLEAVMQRAHDLGIVMSTEEATAAAEMVDRWTELKGVLKMATVQIGSALAPAIESVTQSLTETLSPAIAWIKANQELVVTVGKLAVATVALGAALKVVGIAATVAAANPLVLILGAAAGAALYFSGALDELTRSTRAYSHEAEDALAKGDKRRAQTVNQVSELEALAEKESLNSDEMERAKSIIAALTDQYGDLGLRIDATTGKILGLTEAQQRANEEMRRAAEADIRRQIAELEEQQQELLKASTQLTAGEKFELFSGVAVAEAIVKGKGRQEMPVMERIEERQAKMALAAERLAPKIGLLWARLRALHAGETSALTGEERPGEEGQGAFGAAADWQEKLLYRQRQIRRAMIEDSYQRELALINLKYERELRQAEGAEDKIAAIRKTRLLELEALDKKYDAERAKERAKVAKDEAALRREIAQLEIKAELPAGRAREKALLELERARAIAEAAQISPELARLTARKYDLLARDIAGAGREGFTVGTFSKFGLAGLGMGGPMERAANAAEQGALDLRRIREKIAQPGKVVAVFAK